MVYVDALIDWGWKLGPSCHLVADTIEELDIFAVSIGMKKSWFQLGGRGNLPHYDLTVARRKAAVSKGAIEINRKQLCEIINTYKSKA